MIIENKDDLFNEYLSEHTEHKLKAQANSRFHEFLRQSVKDRVQNCGSFLAFKLFQNIKNAEEFKRVLQGANFCKHRFCIMCEWRNQESFNFKPIQQSDTWKNRTTKNMNFCF